MNKIVLYTVPFNYGDIKQPYFMTDSSRDFYFSQLHHKQVNFDNVNIKIDFNYELIVKVNIDIVEAEDYNFAIVTYNDKNLYCHIMDSEQISFGFSRLMLRRFILAEKTNYLQYFKDFMISKATFPYLNYGVGAKIFLPDYLRYKRLVMFPKIYLNNSFTECEMLPFYQVMLTNNAFDRPSVNVFKDNVQMKMVLIPVVDANDINRTFGIKTHFNTYEGLNDDFGYDVVSTLLNNLSPYIISASLTYLPCVKLVVPSFREYNASTGEYTDKTNSEITLIGYRGEIVRSSGTNPISTFAIEDVGENFYEIRFTGEEETLLEKHQYYMFSRNNSIIVEPSRFYKNGSISYNIRFLFIPTLTSTQILCKVYSPDYWDTIENNAGDADQIIFNLNDSASFIVDSAENFKAQNKYYDALTRNTNDYKIAMGVANTVENFGVGATQIGMGVAMSSVIPTAGLSQISMGAGNMIRGLTEIGKTAADVEQYTEERKLNALQEQSKPSESNISGAASVSAVEQKGKIFFICEKPLEEDLSFFYRNLYNFGVKTSLVRGAIDIEEFIKDGEFFIKAIAERNELILNTREYNEMLKYLNAGSIYFII